MMNQLTFYVSGKQRHGGKLFYEWLLEEAKALGVHGGSVFHAIAGFGRHGHLHEETFIELAGELAVQVVFILDDELTDQLLQRVHAQRLDIFYVKHVVNAGVI
jgi:PII-like signaling protein